MLLSVGGLALVMASGCVFNNYIDRGKDAVMSRTAKRALVTNSIRPDFALAYGSLLGVFGFALLLQLHTRISFWTAMFGFVVYIGVYGYAKRHSPHGTLVGALAGATPPVVGYSGATGRIDTTGVILFIILVTWQMPHFYAIAIRRAKEYKAARIPVLPLISGVRATIQQMQYYTVGFILSVVSLSVFSNTSYSYLVVMLGIGLWWFKGVYDGAAISDTSSWAKQVFKQSLVVLMVFSLMISLDNLLP